MGNTLKNIQPLIRCPVCQKKYEPGGVLLLAEDGKRTTLHVHCGACGISSFVYVSLSAMGAVSFGVLTDLDRHEVKHWHHTEPISADEALKERAFLKKFRGGVEKYLTASRVQK